MSSNAPVIDPRAASPERLVPPAPLPLLSRRALARVKHPLPIPTVCPHCSGRVELMSNAAVYGSELGEWPYVYACTARGCGAYVGVHPATDLPLGTLADKATRFARYTCKRSFERIWRSKLLSRNAAYGWLAVELGIAPEECHFGLFDVARCEQARYICDEFLERANA